MATAASFPQHPAHHTRKLFCVSLLPPPPPAYEEGCSLALIFHEGLSSVALRWHRAAQLRLLTGGGVHMTLILAVAPGPEMRSQSKSKTLTELQETDKVRDRALVPIQEPHHCGAWTCCLSPAVGIGCHLGATLLLLPPSPPRHHLPPSPPVLASDLLRHRSLLKPPERGGEWLPESAVNTCDDSEGK